MLFFIHEFDTIGALSGRLATAYVQKSKSISHIKQSIVIFKSFIYTRAHTPKQKVVISRIPKFKILGIELFVGGGGERTKVITFHRPYRKIL